MLMLEQIVTNVQIIPHAPHVGGALRRRLCRSLIWRTELCDAALVMFYHGLTGVRPSIPNESS
jgi:hypothetical protein